MRLDVQASGVVGHYSDHRDMLMSRRIIICGRIRNSPPYKAVARGHAGIL